MLEIPTEQMTEAPILRFARRLEALNRHSDVLDVLELGEVERDRVPGDGGNGHGKAGQDWEMIEASILVTEDLISDTSARNLDEAAVQLMLACTAAEALHTGVVGEQADLANKAEKLVRSALTEILRHTDIDLSEFGVERYVVDYDDLVIRTQSEELDPQAEHA